MRLTFRGSTVLLLGGSSQIGKALTSLLLEEGLRVFPAHASPEGRQSIAASFPQLTACSPCLNLEDTDSLDCFLGSNPVIDYLVDLAHGHLEGLFAASTPEADNYLVTHIVNRQRLLRGIARGMLSRRFGRLLYVSSTAAALPAPGQSLYGASKCACEALYQSVGLEMGDRGLTSLNVRLGLTDAGRGKSFLATSEHEIPNRYVLSLEQAATTLCYVLSDQALAFTCTTLTLDAGLTARKYI